MNARKHSIKSVDWHAVQRELRDMTEDDSRIVDLLVVGSSTPVIARRLGMSRSAVWRRIQKLMERFDANALSGPP